MAARMRGTSARSTPVPTIMATFWQVFKGSACRLSRSRLRLGCCGGLLAVLGPALLLGGGNAFARGGAQHAFLRSSVGMIHGGAGRRGFDAQLRLDFTYLGCDTFLLELIAYEGHLERGVIRHGSHFASGHRFLPRTL